MTRVEDTPTWADVTDGWDEAHADWDALTPEERADWDGDWWAWTQQVWIEEQPDDLAKMRHLTASKGWKP